MANTAHYMDHLTSDDVVRIIGENLSLEHRDGDDGDIIIQLKLGEKSVGKAMRLGIDWKQDHGHGGGSYVNGLTLEEI